MSKIRYKNIMLFKFKHLEIYIDNELSLGVECTHNFSIVSINLLYLKIDLF